MIIWLTLRKLVDRVLKREVTWLEAQNCTSLHSKRLRPTVSDWSTMMPSLATPRTIAFLLLQSSE